MKSLKLTKLTNQEMKKVMGGTKSDNVRPNVEKQVFRQEFGQQMGGNR